MTKQHTPELPDCNQDVFDHGYVYGVIDMPKEKAELFCKEKSEETGNQFDWHYHGGRAVVKCLTKERAAELLAERERAAENEKLKQKNTEMLRALTILSAMNLGSYANSLVDKALAKVGAR